MGMFDTVIVLDEALHCPHDHRLSGFQTKSFEDPAMDTYLVNRGGIHRVARGTLRDSDEEAVEHWRIEGGEALFQRRHSLETMTGPREIVFYTTCPQCTPVLVRRDYATVWGDLIDERQLWVEFRATVIPGEAPRIERTSGTRADLIAELREEGDDRRYERGFAPSSPPVGQHNLRYATYGPRSTAAACR